MHHAVFWTCMRALMRTRRQGMQAHACLLSGTVMLVVSNAGKFAWHAVHRHASSHAHKTLPHAEAWRLQVRKAE